MVLYHSLEIQRATLLPTPAMVDTSWLDLKLSTARVMEPGMTVLQFVDVSFNFFISLQVYTSAVFSLF